MEINQRRKKPFLGLVGNAKYCILFHPMWAIPFNFYFFYLSMYMLASGVTQKQIGILVLLGSLFSLLFSFVAAPVVDAFGRKKSVLFFDLISSVLPPLIYLISANFLFSMIAVVFTNANKIMSVAYYLIMIEDASENETVRSFNYFNQIMIASGIITPLIGLLVSQYGLIYMERILLGISTLCMLILILWRNHYFEETVTGKIIMEKSKFSFTLEVLMKPYIDSYVILKNDKTKRLVIFANILLYVYMLVGTNMSLYFVPVLYNVLQLDVLSTSIVGSAYYVGMLTAMILIVPRLYHSNIFRSSLLGVVINIAGFILMLLIPKNNIIFAVIAAFIMSLGYGVVKTYSEASLAISTNGDNRSGVYSFINGVSSLIGIFIGSLCSVLFSYSAQSIVIISILILVIIGICYRNLYIHTEVNTRI